MNLIDQHRGEKKGVLPVTGQDPALDQNRTSIRREDVNGPIGFKLDDPVFFRVQREIIAPADKMPGAELGSALADDDASGRHPLAPGRLHSESLRIRVPSVCRTSLRFCMCHDGFPVLALMISF